MFLKELQDDKELLIFQSIIFQKYVHLKYYLTYICVNQKKKYRGAPAVLLL